MRTASLITGMDRTRRRVVTNKNGATISGATSASRGNQLRQRSPIHCGREQFGGERYQQYSHSLGRHRPGTAFDYRAAGQCFLPPRILWRFFFPNLLPKFVHVPSWCSNITTTIGGPLAAAAADIRMGFHPCDASFASSVSTSSLSPETILYSDFGSIVVPPPAADCTITPTGNS